MKTSKSVRILLFVALNLAPVSALRAADPTAPALDPSFRNEVERALTRGLEFLQRNQNSNGWWSTPDHPAVSALALSAFMGAPGDRYRQNPPPFIRNGYRYLQSCAKPDGSIYVTNMANYNTSIAMMAMVASGDPAHHVQLRRSRAYLAGTQIDFGKPGELDTPFDGGVGYGNKYAHSDMNNTLTAIEAMYYTRHLATESGPDAKDLNWGAVATFLQNCQNLPAVNHQPYATDDPKHVGGFFYYPSNSMAGLETNAAGRVALRSYGSISYGGLLSYIYADLKKTDPRVEAVMNWLRRNYTLDENPGMGPQGYYYYLHLMTKALNLHGTRDLELASGRQANWRREVAMQLINRQGKDGSWINDNGRWWERDPALVTAYAVMTLEIIWRDQ